MSLYWLGLVRVLSWLQHKKYCYHYKYLFFRNTSRFIFHAVMTLSMHALVTIHAS